MGYRRLKGRVVRALSRVGVRTTERERCFEGIKERVDITGEIVDNVESDAEKKLFPDIDIRGFIEYKVCAYNSFERANVLRKRFLLSFFFF